jgi:hypothetical protein
MSGLIASLTQKAQDLAQNSPLAGKIPGTTAPDAATSGSTSSGGSSSKNRTLESLHHQLRQLGQQYS